MNLLKGTTPGPWSVFSHFDSYGIRVMADGHTVGWAANAASERPGETIANSKLIAAAPDLAREVELLREFLGFIEEIDTLKRPLTLMERHLYRLGLSYHREFSKEKEDA